MTISPELLSETLGNAIKRPEVHMAIPVPNSIAGLRDALMREITSLDAYMQKMEAEHSFEAYARLAGYTTPKYKDGKPIFDSIDTTLIPYKDIDIIDNQAGPYSTAVGYVGKGMVIKVPNIFDDNKLSPSEKVKRCVVYFDSLLGELSCHDNHIIQQNLIPLRTVIIKCKMLSQAFLENQPGATKVDASALPQRFENFKSSMLKELDALDATRLLESDTRDQALLRSHESEHLRNLVMIPLHEELPPNECVAHCLSALESFAKSFADSQNEYGNVSDVQAVLDACLAHCRDYRSYQSCIAGEDRGGAGGAFYR